MAKDLGGRLYSIKVLEYIFLSCCEANLDTGSACNLLSIIGVRLGTSDQEASLESEMRRRRCWATFLAHCHNGESLSTFPITGMDKLALPWLETHFEAGFSANDSVTLTSRQSGGGIYAKLIEAMMLW